LTRAGCIDAAADSSVFRALVGDGVSIEQATFRDVQRRSMVFIRLAQKENRRPVRLCGVPLDDDLGFIVEA
jgi:hypothetical protein